MNGTEPLSPPDVVETPAFETLTTPVVQETATPAATPEPAPTLGQAARR
jgi:hypothetical protein